MNKDFEAKNAKYDIEITDGTGTESIADGTYSVSADAPGYDNDSILPVSVSVTADVLVYDFTIAATGTLTLHVTEEGTAAGTAVEGAKFVRTDSTGAETYGDEIESDEDGNAVFMYVPYGTTEAVYYKQTATAEGHEFDPEVKSITLVNQSETVEIQNAAIVERTFNLTDANYDGLKISAATLTLEN